MLIPLRATLFRGEEERREPQITISIPTKALFHVTLAVAGDGGGVKPRVSV